MTKNKFAQFFLRHGVVLYHHPWFVINWPASLQLIQVLPGYQRTTSWFHFLSLGIAPFTVQIYLEFFGLCPRSLMLVQ